MTILFRIAETNWLVITFAMIGKFAISASFGMAWIYTMEVYPTSIRAIGLNMWSTFARFASVPASYVGMLVGAFFKNRAMAPVLETKRDFNAIIYIGLTFSFVNLYCPICSYIVTRPFQDLCCSKKNPEICVTTYFVPSFLWLDDQILSSFFQSDISRELPLLIFGAMALLGGVLVFVLPETRDQPMRQTVYDGEEFVRQNICQFGPCKRYEYFHL